MSVAVGQKAPDFTLKNTDMQDVHLASFHGKSNVLLLFYPLVNTPVCEGELCGIRDDLNAYTGHGAEVIALSVDSPFAAKLWKEKHNYNFTMVSDFNKEVSTAYGAIHDVLGATGLKGVSKRSAFVIDKNGDLQYVWISDDPKQVPDFAAIKEVLGNLG